MNDPRSIPLSAGEEVARITRQDAGGSQAQDGGALERHEEGRGATERRDGHSLLCVKLWQLPYTIHRARCGDHVAEVPDVLSTHCTGR